MRNRLLERNNIGSTYLLTKFAKPLLLRIVGRADGPPRVLSRNQSFWNFIWSWREFSERGHNDLHGTNIPSRGKGSGIMGFAPAGCVSGLFWISECLKDYSLFITLVGKGGGYLGITWFSEGTTGDHLFPRVYVADYRMWLLLFYLHDHKNIAEPYGGGGRSGKFYRDSSKILRSSLLHVNSCKLLYNSSTITV